MKNETAPKTTGAKQRLQSLFVSPLRKTVERVRGIFQNNAEIDLAVLSLFREVMWTDGKIGKEEKEILLEQFPQLEDEVSLINSIQSGEQGKLPDFETAIKELAGQSDSNKRALLAALVDLAVADKEYSEAEGKLIADISVKLGLEPEYFGKLEREAREKLTKKRTFLNSSGGVLAALVVIAIFILTATFLKSVLFGLILAYLAIPLQRYYKKRLVGPDSESAEVSSEKERETKKRKRMAKINLSSNLAVGTVLSALLFFFVAIVVASGLYVGSLQPPTELTETAPAEKAGEIAPNQTTAMEKKEGWQGKLQEIQHKIETHPWFETIKKQVGTALIDEKTKNSLMMKVAARSSGILSYTATFLSTLFAFLLDAVLTVFFFSFFLQKFSLWNDEHDGGGKKAGEHVAGYLVGVVFNSHWLPYLDRGTRKDAQKIISEIFAKLNTWVKGYFSIILTETILYVLLFMILRLPYGIVLGILAGFTVLLPFIGPLASCLLTLLVYIGASGSFNIPMVAAILVVYAVMNLIVEQLILYPRLIGERLGLNSLETIVVVLLGGVFAGLAGMIFAIPAAAILKYLVPKIYGSLQPAAPPSDE